MEKHEQARLAQLISLGLHSARKLSELLEKGEIKLEWDEEVFLRSLTLRMNMNNRQAGLEGEILLFALGKFCPNSEWFEEVEFKLLKLKELIIDHRLRKRDVGLQHIETALAEVGDTLRFLRMTEGPGYNPRYFGDPLGGP